MELVVVLQRWRVGDGGRLRDPNAVLVVADRGLRGKLEQAGVYAHVNRKFTGYRNGKFREQLEVRQRKQKKVLVPTAGMI